MDVLPLKICGRAASKNEFDTILIFWDYVSNNTGGLFNYDFQLHKLTQTPAGIRDLLFFAPDKVSRPPLSLIQSPVQWVTGFSFLGVKRPGLTSIYC
jgi:hypothetical protein